MQEEVPASVTPSGSSSTAAATPHNLKRPVKKAKHKTPAPTDNFELEDNDNWPDVDVGNLIIDLDDDINKSAMSTVSPSASMASSTTSQVASQGGGNPSTATVVSSSMTPISATGPSSSVGGMASGSASKLKTLVTTNCNSNSVGSATQTLTETTTLTSSGGLHSASATSPASASDKKTDLKMKIKRTKQGSRHPEGKLEIVPNKDHRDGSGAAAAAAASSSGSTSPAASPADASAAASNVNGNNPFVPGDLSAADILAAAKAAAIKQGGPKAVGGNKVTLSSKPSQSSQTSASSNKPRGSDKQTNGRPFSSDSKGNSSSSNNNGKKSKSTASEAAASNGPPAAKRQKVDASVGTEIGTMTEPDCLGPLDPGTSVTLEGIVWNETDGVLVINVTWRGKTYVGTLLDSTRHVNQWAPPRYSDSPTSEMESRTPKGRSKRGGRGSGTPVETETTRKNLRSNSKSKGGSRSTSTNLNSPAKRKGRGSDGDEKSGDDSNSKRKRTDSSRNSPDDDEDSEKDTKGGNDSDSATSSVKGKDDKDDLDLLAPKDEEEKRYIPPPPLPYALLCPKSTCKKRYRQHNGLRFHVSHAHPELLDDVGNIRDTSEIDRMEKEAKERLNVKDEPSANDVTNGTNGEATDSSNSGSSSKTSTPVPSEAVTVSSSSSTSSSTTSTTTTASTAASEAAAAVAAISVPLPPTSLKGPPLDAKPIPVSAIEGGIPANARPPPPVLQTTALPLVTRAPGLPPQAHIKPIRPPVNARPIVPATGPQIMPGGSLGPSAINLKPIQPRPTIMPDPTPNLALDDLKKAKKPKKHSGNSPGNSPPRGLNGNSPKTASSSMVSSISNKDNQMTSLVDPPAKSPAYSDISDDENDRKMKSALGRVTPGASVAASAAAAPSSALSVPVPPSVSTSAGQPGSLAGQPGPPPPPPPFSIPGPFGLPPTASLPTVPVSPQQAQKEKKEVVTGPQPGTIEYEKMLLAYGFPPFPYPIPPGMDPAMHMHMLATDPVYKAKYEKDRAEKEKAFKEQIDRDNREKDRKAGVKLPEEREAEQKKSMISVKPEFRDLKKEVMPRPSSTHNTPKAPTPTPPPPPRKVEDEGIKATMETRGPPPATPTSFAGLMHPGMMGAMGVRPPFGYDPAMLAGVPPHVLASLYGAAGGAPGGSPNPYMPQSLAGLRSPFFPNASSASPEDLSRSAALAMQAAVSSLAGAGGSSSTKALDLLQQHANQYYAAIAASAGAGGASTITSTSSSSPSSHKIHELQERALKSPVTSRGSGTSSPNVSFSSKSSGLHSAPTTTVTMASMAPKTSDLLSSKRTPSPSSRTTPTGSRSRSPPPLRHVHTHTHTHFGLGYPPLGIPGGLPGVTGPPAAHTPFPPAGFPSHLLPGKPPLPGALPSFPPPK